MTPFPPPPPGLLPPGMPPPPGMGPPGMPPPPMPPPPEPPPQDPVLMLLGAVAKKVSEQGEETVRADFASLDDETLAAVRDLASTDPAAADLILPLLPPEPERVPRYPAWFRTPPKPSKDDVQQALTAGRGYWQETWEVRAREDLALYTQAARSRFRSHKRDHDEDFVSPALVNDLEATVAAVGTAAHRYTVPVLEPELRDEAQRVEDALLYWDRLADRTYRRALNNDFRSDLVRYFGIIGYAMGPCILNPADPERPFVEGLVDPTTCFPLHDGHGLAVMVRDYTDTIGQIIADYDDGSGGVERALRAKVNTSTQKPYAWRDTVQVTAYWDRWWYGVWVNDVPIVPIVAHEYGFVPWIVVGSGMGEPVGLSGTFADARTQAGISGAEVRAQHKHWSHFTARKGLHGIREAAIAKALTLFSFIDQPAWMVVQDVASEAAGAPKIVNEANKVNTFKQGETVAPLNPAVINPAVAQTVFSAIAQDQASSVKPPAFYGVFESANQSGNATEGALEAGRDKDTPYVLATQAFLEARAEMRLVIWRDWGHTVEGWNGEMGRLRVPYQDRRRLRSNEPAFDLTPEMIDRVGTLVEADLTTLRLQNLGPLGNAVAIWISNGLMSRREAMELRGVFDPDDVIDEIEFEQIAADPELQRLRKYKLLRERDPELAALYMQMLMQPSPQQSGPPGLGPGGPMAPNTSAMGMPQLGMPQMGPTGRPPIPPPPGMAPGTEP